MEICVFCSSADHVDDELLRQAKNVGETLALRGHQLVYGGTPLGTMRSLVDGVRQAGGRVTGVVPAFMMELGIADKDCDKLVIADDLLDRKRLMISLSDGFIALPGGLGTIDELVEVMTHIYLDQLEAPVALVDGGGFWEPLLTFFRGLEEYGVTQVPPGDLLQVCSSADEAFLHLEDVAV